MLVNPALSALTRCVAEEDDLSLSSGSTLFVNAQAHSVLDLFDRNALVCLQGGCHHYSILKARGFDVLASLAELHSDRSRFDRIVICGVQHRAWMQAWFQLAPYLLNENGEVLVAVENELGARTLEKHFAKRYPVAGNYSKYHSRVFWASVPKMVEEEGSEFSDLTAKLRGELVVDGLLGLGRHKLAVPLDGFSTKKADTGSQILLESLPFEKLSGRGADFGAGFGLLSWGLWGAGARPDSLVLFDSHHGSLECARMNLAPLKDLTEIEFVWGDLHFDFKGVEERFEGRFDWVVMNPPFHSGKAKSVELGRSFFKRAASCLRRGGKLFSVFNNNLPYQDLLASHFQSSTKVLEKSGYRIVESVR